MMSNVGLKMEYTSVYQIYIKCFWEKWWLTIRIVYFPSYQVKVPNPRWQYKEPRFWGILSWDLYPGSFNENRFKLTFHLNPWKQCPIDPSDLYDTKQQTWGYNWDSAKMMVKRLTLFGCKAQWCICNLALDENDISSREASTCTAKQVQCALSWERRWLSSFQSAVQSALSREMRARRWLWGFLTVHQLGESWTVNVLEVQILESFRGNTQPPSTSFGWKKMEQQKKTCRFSTRFVTFWWIGIDLDLFFSTAHLSKWQRARLWTHYLQWILIPVVPGRMGGQAKHFRIQLVHFHRPLHYTILLYIYISRCTYGYYIYYIYIYISTLLQSTMSSTSLRTAAPPLCWISVWNGSIK